MPTTLKELHDAVERLPDTVQAALKAQAKETAEAVARRAAEILRFKTHGTGATAAAIRVLDESDRKQWVVNSPGDPKDPANLPMWLEFGTRHMTSRAYMRPAADEASQDYIRDMTAAAEKAAQEALG